MNDEANAKSLSLHVLELHVGVKEIFRDQTFQFVLIEMARKNRRNILMSDSLQRMSNKTDIFFCDTDKCTASRSWSNPVPLSLEFGSGPVSRLSARSSQVTLESFPNEGGMLPVNLFEFRALCNIKPRNKISVLLVGKFQ